MSPGNLEAVNGFLEASSGPLIFAFLVAISDVRQRRKEGRRLLVAVYVAFASLWVSVGLPSTGSTPASAYFWRNGFYWGLWGGAAAGGLWILWSLVKPVPPDPPGFDVITKSDKRKC